jgi:hypothetical protein
MAKFRILRGKALTAYLKKHPRLARAVARAHIRMLRIRVRVRHPKPKAVSARALALASHFVGLKEHPAGSNITIFGRWYGENGVPWCAIFVSYILSHTGRPFKYAYVPSIVADARAHKNGLRRVAAASVNRALAAGHPVLACYDWNHDGTADHVEFVRRVVGDNLEAVGGNTGPADWSNGGEVANETRPISYVQAFVEAL